MVLTVEETAKVLRISTQTVRRRIKDGTLKAYKFCGRWFVYAEEIERIRRYVDRTD